MKTLFALFFLLVFNCGGSQEVITQEHDEKMLMELREEIYEMVEQATCSGESECKYIGFGSKPCGGFWEYLVYSNSVDEEALKLKVEHYNQLEKKYNIKWKVVSDCTVVNPPKELVCENGKCKAVY